MTFHQKCLKRGRLHAEDMQCVCYTYLLKITLKNLDMWSTDFNNITKPFAIVQYENKEEQ